MSAKHLAYQIKIDKPCGESWAAMEKADNGRYCTHCAKNVIDFTNMSDSAIVQLIAQSKGNICGRLNVSQLNRTITKPPEVNKPTRFYRIMASLLLFSGYDGLAKTTHSSTVQNVPDKDEKADTLITVKKDGHKNRVELKIIDAETKKGIPGVLVLVEKAAKAISDKNGSVTFIIPDRAPDSLVFHISMPHPYVDMEFTIEKTALPLAKEILGT
jgi:hypothetical protein